MQNPTTFHGWLIVAPGVPVLQVTTLAVRGSTCEQCSNEVDLYLVTPRSRSAHGTITCHGCLVTSLEQQATTGEQFYQPVN